MPYFIDSRPLDVPAPFSSDEWGEFRQLDGEHVARIYHPQHRTHERRQKVLVLCNIYHDHPAEFGEGFAFPIQPVYETAPRLHALVGCTMRSVAGLPRLLDLGFDPVEGKFRAPFTDADALAVVYELFAALDKLHRYHLVLGNVGPDRFLFQPGLGRPLIAGIEFAQISQLARADGGTGPFEAATDVLATAALAQQFLTGNSPDRMVWLRSADPLLADYFEAVSANQERSSLLATLPVEDPRHPGAYFLSKPSPPVNLPASCLLPPRGEHGPIAEIAEWPDPPGFSAFLRQFGLRPELRRPGSATPENFTGGFLAALSEAACGYVRGIVPPGALKPVSSPLLERLVVHTHPHLDEYFAQFLFRLALPADQRPEFVEQSIFSEHADLSCQHLWPHAAVFGIGRGVGGGARALFLYDEHIVDEEAGIWDRCASSCSRLVADAVFQDPAALPEALRTVLFEVDHIDAFGQANAQNLANLIKQLHETEFSFEAAPEPLHPAWKRAIVDACLVAVLYCLHEGIDLIDNPREKKKSLKISLENYLRGTPHQDGEDFEASAQWLRNSFLNQESVFREARLRHGPRDEAEELPPEHLIFGRVCYACERCWGPGIRDLVATHFWEVLLQNRLNFGLVRRGVEGLFEENLPALASRAGQLRRETLPELMTDHGLAWPWLIGLEHDSSISSPNRAIIHFINQYNSPPGRRNWQTETQGCGLAFVQNRTLGTSAIFKCGGIPDDKWEVLVRLLQEKEPRCWHAVTNPNGKLAPFVINGNRAHRYRPRTNLTFAVLVELLRGAWYEAV